MNFPSTLEFVGEFSFYQCKKLSQPITFNFIKLAIGKSAFEGCSGLKNSVLTFKEKNLSSDLNIDFDAFKNIKFSSVIYQGENQIEYE